MHKINSWLNAWVLSRLFNSLHIKNDTDCTSNDFSRNINLGTIEHQKILMLRCAQGVVCRYERTVKFLYSSIVYASHVTFVLYCKHKNTNTRIVTRTRSSFWPFKSFMQATWHLLYCVCVLCFVYYTFIVYLYLIVNIRKYIIL